MSSGSVFMKFLVEERNLESVRPTFKEVAAAREMFKNDDLKFASLGFGADLENAPVMRCRECERKDPNRPGMAFCYLCGRKSPHARMTPTAKLIGKPPLVSLYCPNGNVSGSHIQRIADSLRGESVITIPRMTVNAGWLSRARQWWKYVNGETPTW